MIHLIIKYKTMIDLIEDYIHEELLKSKPKVIIYSLELNLIEVTYKDEYTEGNASKTEISIWELLEFVYNKTKQL